MTRKPGRYTRFIIIITVTSILLASIIIGGLTYYYYQFSPISITPEFSNSSSQTIVTVPQEIEPVKPILSEPIKNTQTTPKKPAQQPKQKVNKKDTSAHQSAPLPTPILDVQQANTQSSELSNTINTRTVTVTNNITKKMLTYSHWTGRYKPTTFAIFIDGELLPEGETRRTVITDNHITIFYRYSFMNGYRTGARNITFAVDPTIDSLSLTFAWKNKWHVLLDHASPEKAEEIPFKE